MIANIRNDTVNRLWIETYKLNVLYKENWTAMAIKEFEHFQRVLIDAFKDGYWPLDLDDYHYHHHHNHDYNHNDNDDQDGTTTTTNNHDQKHEQQTNNQPQTTRTKRGRGRGPAHGYTRWSFIDSWMYSISIITTIGQYYSPIWIVNALKIYSLSQLSG